MGVRQLQNESQNPTVVGLHVNPRPLTVPLHDALWKVNTPQPSTHLWGWGHQAPQAVHIHTELRIGVRLEGQKWLGWRTCGGCPVRD